MLQDWIASFGSLYRLSPQYWVNKLLKIAVPGWILDFGLALCCIQGNTV
jgi:hypothetical protein